MTVNHLYDAVYHTLSQCVCYWTIRVSQFYDSESPVSCVWQLRENCTKCMIHICDTVTVFDTYIWKCLLLTMELWARLFHRQFLLGRIGWILRIMMMMTICRGGSNHGFYGRWTEERYDEIFRYKINEKFIKPEQSGWCYIFIVKYQHTLLFRRVMLVISSTREELRQASYRVCQPLAADSCYVTFWQWWWFWRSWSY